MKEIKVTDESILRSIRSAVPRSYEEEMALLNTRARYDVHYRNAGRLGAPEPLQGESNSQFRGRMLTDLSRYHPDWSKANPASINDETALRGVEEQIFSAAKEFGPSYGLKDGQIKEVHGVSPSGHREISFVGGPNSSFVDQFRRAPARATFADKATYQAMERTATLQKITHLVPKALRSVVGLNHPTA